MNETVEIRNILREYGYSERAIKEVLKWYVDDYELEFPKTSIRGEGCRSWMDVIECILGKTIGGSDKVHVMHRCNLTKGEFQVYLDFLSRVGFIREVEQSIETTEKGLAFLQAYNGLKALLGK